MPNAFQRYSLLLSSLPDSKYNNRHLLIKSLKRQNKWPEYKKQRNYVTNLIKRKKKNVITELIKTNKTNTKPLWDALKVNRSENGLSINTACLSSDEFNTHFTSIAKSLTKDIPKSNDDYLKNIPESVHKLDKITLFTPEISLTVDDC